MLMKKNKVSTILLTSLSALALSANAATVVFTEDFVGANNAGSTFGVQTLNDPLVASTSIFNGNNGFTIDGTAGTVSVDSIGNARSSTFFINLNGFAPGTYNIDFDISGFRYVSDRADAALFSSLSLVTGLGVTAADSIDFDLHDSAGNFDPDTNPIDLAPSAGSNATVTDLGPDIIFAQGVQPAPLLTAPATNTGSFTLTNAGDANSFLAVSLIRDPGTGGGVQTSDFTVDTVTIELIPEPSSTLLLGLSAFAFLSRRRR